tara:strand:+ start:569 stop:754 length:186 start_codon:yes stop_codon:yes gene_type:complete
MNKLKFTNYNALGQPQNVILKYANGDVEVLEFAPNTRYYDSFDKKYRSYPSFTTIKTRTYA